MELQKTGLIFAEGGGFVQCKALPYVCLLLRAAKTSLKYLFCVGLETGAFSDLTLVADNREYRVHRIVRFNSHSSNWLGEHWDVAFSLFVPLIRLCFSSSLCLCYLLTSALLA
jgi:hypothetical protein